MKKQIFLQIMFSDEKYSDIDKLLDEALKSEPQFNLSDDFANVVAEKMSRKFAWEQYLMEFLIYFAAIVGLAVVPVAIQFIFFGAQWQDWLQFIVANISVVTGIAFLIVFILFADRVLLRYFLHKTSTTRE